MDLTQLIYVSSASVELSDAQLDDILASAVRHNKDNEITGLLLYAHGSFMQVLEGDRARVEETYTRILHDLRHRSSMVLHKEPIDAREFPDWSMAIRHLGPRDAEAHPGYAPYFEHGFDIARIGSRQGLATELMKLFIARDR